MTNIIAYNVAQYLPYDEAVVLMHALRVKEAGQLIFQMYLQRTVQTTNVKHSIEHRVDGVLCRWYEPAVRTPTTTEWWFIGKLHNTTGPAVINANGKVEYWQYGKLHNANGPAVIYPDGSVEYWQNGKLHNPYGPAIRHADGRIEYYINGMRHCEDGPAVIYPRGRIEYWRNNQLHNMKGPAVIRTNGKVEYWQYGKCMGISA